MDFFDFDLAAENNNDSNPQDAYQPCIANCDGEINPCLAAEPCFDSFDQLPDDLGLFPPSAIDPAGTNDCEMANYADFESMIPGWVVPTHPCDNCAVKHLECFVIYKGQKACTSCVTLFRECSFDPKERPSSLVLDDRGGPRGLTTLHDVAEDAAVALGSATGKRLLRSTQHLTEDVLEKRGRKTGTRFSREAVRVLKDWLSQHADHPYPTDEEKDHLKQQTGLKRSQISNWLANARRRGKAAAQRSHSPSVSCTNSTQGLAIPTPVDRQTYQNMGPLERWKQSPPENEPASVSAIANAVASSVPALDKDSSPYSGSLQDNRDSSAGSSFSVFRAPSMSSVETGRSSKSGSDMSFSSLFSHQSRRSFGSASKDRRRRRRQPSNQPVNVREAPRPFQCTFCTDTFKTKHDWSRHEKSLHLSLERWTCAPLGGIIPFVDPTTGEEKSQCVFCHCIDPDASHLEMHNYSQCYEKSVADRTFYRKDHLTQHLRLTHACTLLPSMQTWKTAPAEIRSRCGFCDETFATWAARTEHLSKHFKDGKTMADWTGDWGFDRFVLKMVENALPPWLISQERQAMVPLSAEKLATQVACALGVECDGGDGVINDARHCYQRLERGLTKYLQEQLAQGVLPTDKDLQKAGRIAVYGVDDPWNQSAADNAEWLSRFKKIHGLDDPNRLQAGTAFTDDLNYCSFALGESRLDDSQS